ncbi:MAG: TRAP transporter small permease [Peptococcaceae bacterium]|nr:TRAP transporter small permease [Peptococcaceae bacterium]
MKKIFDYADWIINKFMYFGGTIILLLMFYTTVNTIMRFFNHPLPGDIEITVNAQVCIIYSTIAACVLSDTHIRVDILKSRPWLEHFNNLFAFATAMFISIQSFKQGLSVAKMNYVSQLLQIPRAPFVFIACLGFFLFALAVLSVEYRLIDSQIQAGKRKDTREVVR